jgi:hypothetical protein
LQIIRSTNRDADFVTAILRQVRFYFVSNVFLEFPGVVVTPEGGGELGISAVAGNFRTAKRDQIMQDIAADYSTNIKTTVFSRRNGNSFRQRNRTSWACDGRESLNVTPIKMVMSSTDQIFLLAVIGCMTSPRQTGLEIDKFPPTKKHLISLERQRLCG